MNDSGEFNTASSLATRGKSALKPGQLAYGPGYISCKNTWMCSKLTIASQFHRTCASKHAKCPYAKLIRQHWME